MVDLADVISLQKIISIKDKKSIKALQSVSSIDFSQQIIERITFTNLFCAESGEYFSSGVESNLSSVIGAVVCNHINCDKFCRIFLQVYAFYQIRKNLFFISCGNKDRITVQLVRFSYPLL